MNKENKKKTGFWLGKREKGGTEIPEYGGIKVFGKKNKKIEKLDLGEHLGYREKQIEDKAEPEPQLENKEEPKEQIEQKTAQDLIDEPDNLNNKEE